MNKLLLLICWVQLAATAFAADSDYRIVKKLPVGGEGGWDYLTVDGPARRLYLARSTHVMVMDLDTEKVVGDIPDTPGVHGIAVAPELNRGFTSNGRENSSTIFELSSLKVVGKVPCGTNPDAITYDPRSRRVFTFNGRSRDATVFDAVTGKVVRTIPLGGKPEFSTTDGTGKIYVNIEDTNEVVELDGSTADVVQRFPLKPCEEPTGMGIDSRQGRLYSGCGNKLMTVLDLRGGKLLATLPIGADVDGNGYDAGTGLAFSANGEGTLTLAKETSPGHFQAVQTVKTQRGSRTMAIDPVTHNIYLPAAQFTTSPMPTPDNPKARPEMVKGSFEILVVGK